MTPCDDVHSQIPFEIVGIHKPCLNSQSCISEINIKLFDDTGTMVEDIILSQDRTGTN